MIFHLYNGVDMKSLFTARLVQSNSNPGILSIHIERSALFTHIVKSKRLLEKLEKGKHIYFHFDNCCVIDHSYLEFITHFKNDYEQQGGKFELIGLDAVQPISDHPLATRKLKK
jgi:MFS superfamily sulfate permease-like transporter